MFNEGQDLHRNICPNLRLNLNWSSEVQNVLGTTIPSQDWNGEPLFGLEAVLEAWRIWRIRNEEEWRIRNEDKEPPKVSWLGGVL